MISKDELTEAILMVFPMSRLNILDENYSLPEDKWVKNEFYYKLVDYRRALKTVTYFSQVNDCDDFGISAWEFCRRCHRLTVSDYKSAIAFGLLIYKTDTGSGHCMNLYVTKEDGNLVVKTFEPQTGFEKKLSVNEMESQCIILI